MPPALSFGLPVHDGERFLPTALESLLDQDLEDIEVVVSDNGSTDGTEEICRAAAAADPRVRYHRSPTNRGGTWNYREVLARSSAPLFSWMAVDDVKLPSFASACLKGLDAHPEAVLATTRARLIDGAGVVFEDLRDTALGLDAGTAHERVRNLYRSQASHVMYGVVRRSALDRARPLLPMVGDDIVLLTELLCQGPAVVVGDQAFLQRRVPEQLSLQGHEQVKWHAPSARVRFAFPQTRLNLELYRAVATTDLPWREKARCWGTVAPAWVLPRWRAMARDVATAAGVHA
ncbi:glycosyltransferase family 2 protein [Isoptericola sp. NPDC057559]|uniref:glycosyltransferase family 2 protein n=1 Tax=Isoptericola sp. NPDC057559 TaxID=3346168 RepID=UPI0036AFA1AD